MTNVEQSLQFVKIFSHKVRMYSRPPFAVFLNQSCFKNAVHSAVSKGANDTDIREAILECRCKFCESKVRQSGAIDPVLRLYVESVR